MGVTPFRSSIFLHGKSGVLRMLNKPLYISVLTSRSSCELQLRNCFLHYVRVTPVYRTVSGMSINHRFGHGLSYRNPHVVGLFLYVLLCLRVTSYVRFKFGVYWSHSLPLGTLKNPKSTVFLPLTTN